MHLSVPSPSFPTWQLSLTENQVRSVVSVCVVSVCVISALSRCVLSLYVLSRCVWSLCVCLCLCDLCLCCLGVCCLGVCGGGGGGKRAGSGMRHRKEEPHTKMWGKIRRQKAKRRRRRKNLGYRMITASVPGKLRLTGSNRTTNRLHHPNPPRREAHTLSRQQSSYLSGTERFQVLVPPLVASLLLVAMPGALAPSSTARSP